MPQLPRPRIRIGGLSGNVYVVTHGKEIKNSKGTFLEASRKYDATADFEDVCREKGYAAPGTLNPGVTILAKLGSIVSHVEEGLDPNGHPLDRVAVRALLEDQGVVEWMAAMAERGLVPVKRGES